jgi:hypothetical protein
MHMPYCASNAKCKSAAGWDSPPHHNWLFNTEVVPCPAFVSDGRLGEQEAENQTEEIRGFLGIIFR